MVEVLTVQEVALILKLHPRTVMKMAVSGEIPAAKVGRQWRFERRLIEDWLAVRMAPHHWVTAHGRSSLFPSRLLEPGQTLLLQPPPRRGEILSLLASRVHPDRPGNGQEELTRLLEEREAMFSTATELGVAFPHPRHPIATLETPVLVLAVVPEGLSFGSPSDAPTYVFALSCSPEDRTHVHLLSILARIFRLPGLVEELRRCSSPQEVLNTFGKAESAALSDQIERAQGSRR
jgi:PTS system nitrogen regulatory IIA component